MENIIKIDKWEIHKLDKNCGYNIFKNEILGNSLNELKWYYTRKNTLKEVLLYIAERMEDEND